MRKDEVVSQSVCNGLGERCRAMLLLSDGRTIVSNVRLNWSQKCNYFHDQSFARDLPLSSRAHS